MKINSNSIVFDHPVITVWPKDFEKDTFDFTYEDQEENDCIYIRSSLEIKSYFLKNGIANGDFEIVYHIEQNGGIYRECINKHKELTSIIELKLSKLKPFKTIEIFPTIVAKSVLRIKEINGLNEVFNFKNSEYVFEKGSIIAYSGTISIPLTGRFDMSSIIQIKPSKTLVDPVSFDFSDPNLFIIEISERIETRYKKIPSKNILRNSFFLQIALIRAIEVIKEDSSYKEGLVYEVLNSIFLKTNSIDIISSHKSAAEIVNEIFNVNDIWGKVYDSIEGEINRNGKN